VLVNQEMSCFICGVWLCGTKDKEGYFKREKKNDAGAEAREGGNEEDYDADGNVIIYDEEGFPLPPPPPPKHEFPVVINVYELDSATIGNQMAQVGMGLLGIQGLYHTGVALNGVEITFGAPKRINPVPGSTGVYACKPMQACGLPLHETIWMGETKPMTDNDLRAYIAAKVVTWEVHLLNHCYHHRLIHKSPNQSSILTLPCLFPLKCESMAMMTG